jgi:hypothetical protein
MLSDAGNDHVNDERVPNGSPEGPDQDRFGSPPEMPTTSNEDSARVIETELAASSCVTCGRPVAERFCTNCGEEVLDAQKLTVRHFVTDSLVPELVNLDGKIWRTLRYFFFRPGFLSLEYAAGRRRIYVLPLRVLLLSIILFAFSTRSGNTMTLSIPQFRFALSLVPVSVPEGRSLGGTLHNIDRFGLLERSLRAKIGPIDDAPAAVTRRFNDTLAGFATPVSFTTVLLFALVLYGLFRRRRPLFVEHAVFSMHCFSFVLLCSLIPMVAIKVDVGSFIFFLLLMFGVIVWQIAYIAIALRRFYWHLDRRRLVPRVQAVGLAVFLFVLNSAFLTGVQLLGGAIAVWRL